MMHSRLLRASRILLIDRSSVHSDFSRLFAPASINHSRLRSSSVRWLRVGALRASHSDIIGPLVSEHNGLHSLGIRSLCQPASPKDEKALIAVEKNSGEKAEKTGEKTARAGADTEKTGEETARAGADTEKTGEETAKSGADTEKIGKETAKAGVETEKTGEETAKAEQVSEETAVQDPEIQKTRWQRVKAELIHYYHGFRLFFVELKIAFRLLGKVFTGHQLSWRERRHFTRTVADIFRIVPFAVFIAVPFMEFLLPFYLKFFPGMLPSTFAQKSKEEEKLRKQMHAKLRVAKFLQDMLEESAVTRSKTATEDVAKELRQFAKFMADVRTGLRQPTIEEILKYTALLKDELALENLDHLQLVCLCQLLGLPSLGPDYFHRLKIRLRLRRLLADDRVIRHDGIESLSAKDLQKACMERGISTSRASEQLLQKQLGQWLEFHLNHKVPITLLVLSRSFYLPDVVSPEQMISRAIAQLPLDMEKNASLKLAESAGVRIDNKERLDQLKRAEDAIAKENVGQDTPDADEVKGVETLATKHTGQEEEKALSKEIVLPISDTDLVASRLASAIMYIASQKHINLSELEVDELKDDVRDHQSNEADPDRSMLSRKIAKLLEGVNSLSDKLNRRKLALEASIEEGGESTTDKDSGSKRQDLVHVSEMLSILDRLKVAGGDGNLDENTVVQVIKQLDLDGDNQIAIADILQVLEYIYSERNELPKAKLQEIAELVAKERLGDSHEAPH